MHSRAYMFLERDYLFLQRHPAWGIEAHPLSEDNFFEWTATIQGLKDTVWEGGVFVVSLKFTEKYNDEPPHIYFHTIPFHPNIDMKTGRPCVDFLDDIDIWKDSYSLHYILLSLQFMLSNPVIENAINAEAANICEDQPDLYMHMVLDCVRASQHLLILVTVHLCNEPKSSGLLLDQEIQVYRTCVRKDAEKISTRQGKKSQSGSETADDEERRPSTDAEEKDGIRHARVSFDEYLTTWTGIATSKPQSNMKNPLLEAIKNDSKLQAAHFGLTLEDLHEQMKRQLYEHNAIMYGNFGRKQKDQDAQDRRLDHISKMRKIYLPKRSAPPPSTAAHSETGEPWDGDAEDLVAWTNELDEDDLEF